MKLIISRKGADSSAVGCPSPVFPDETYFSIPVPGGKNKHLYGWVEYSGHNVGRVLNDLTGFDPTSRSKARRWDWRRTYAHLDPDLDFDSSYTRHPNWKPNLGQQGNPLRHLLKQGVGLGDIFLFFGLFQKVELWEGRWRFMRDSPKEHMFFGYLQVKDYVSGRRQYRKRDWLIGHPHDYPGAKKGHDGIFIGGGDLDFPEISGLPSGAVFSKVSRKRVLTKTGAEKPNCWLLPEAFTPKGRKPLTLHGNPKRWSGDENGVCLECVHRGQEFILDLEHYPELIPWVGSILKPDKHQ